MLKKNSLALSIVAIFFIIFLSFGAMALDFKDAEGTYVPVEGVYMVYDDPNGPIINYVDISKFENGNYEVYIGESYKGAPVDTVTSIIPYTPCTIIGEYKGGLTTRYLLFDGFDTVYVYDEYCNIMGTYFRIYDDVRNHINYNPQW
ncbi:MAG: hypothetical protein E7232_08545 [Lachnospiraceae bacterium]|jgi:hypothetical protein|nr:hypothetical protein [Lachnospiraceae bacterium]